MRLLSVCRLAATALLLSVLSFAPALADGPVLLTVTGAVDKPNRGGYDENTDKFFGFNEVEFDKAAAFSFADLKKLGEVTVRADFPKDGDEHEFTGPLLADVLLAAGASGKKVTIQALDGYAVEASLEAFSKMGAIVAYKKNGKMFGIGDFGPTQIVFPRAERADLKDMNDDLWVWSIFHIRVE